MFFNNFFSFFVLMLTSKLSQCCLAPASIIQDGDCINLQTEESLFCASRFVKSVFWYYRINDSKTT